MNRPSAGNHYALYFLADSHGQNDTWPVNVLRHIEEELPAGARVCVVYGGDLFEIGADEANDSEAIRAHYRALEGNKALTALRKRATFAWQWDDWDYLGDNSCETHTGAQGGARIDRDMALGARAGAGFLLPVGAQTLDPTTAGWSLPFGGALILAPDSRSRKAAVADTDSQGHCRCLLDGRGNPHAWGMDQYDAMLFELIFAREARRIFLLSTQTIVDQLSAPVTPCAGHVYGSRDSLGIYHKWWRNELLAEVRRLGLESKLTILSGDDHTALVRERWEWREPHAIGEEDVAQYDARLNGLTLLEWKAGNGGATTRVFDSSAYPPFWWSGSVAGYQECAWGKDDSSGGDIGFCFRWTPKGEMTASAILFEDDEQGRLAPHTFWTRGVE